MITPGELQKGQFVSVHHWERQEWKNTDSMFGFPVGTETITVQNPDNSYKGEVLEVIAISLPFISVIRRDICKSGQRMFKLDVRQAILIELAKEYIESLIQQ